MLNISLFDELPDDIIDNIKKKIVHDYDVMKSNIKKKLLAYKLRDIFNGINNYQRNYYYNNIIDIRYISNTNIIDNIYSDNIN